MRSNNVMDMLLEPLLKKAAVASLTTEQNVEYNTLHGVGQQVHTFFLVCRTYDSCRKQKTQ